MNERMVVLKTVEWDGADDLVARVIAYGGVTAHTRAVLPAHSSVIATAVQLWKEWCIAQGRLPFAWWTVPVKAVQP